MSLASSAEARATATLHTDAWTCGGNPARIECVMRIGFGNPGVTGILILNGFFAAMVVGSALLFRSAAREQTHAAQGLLMEAILLGVSPAVSG